MIFTKVVSLACFVAMVNALTWNLSDIKCGANDPVFEYDLNQRIKLLVRRRILHKSLVISQRVKNKNLFDLRQELYQIGQKGIKKTDKQKQNKNSRLKKYKTYHHK